MRPSSARAAEIVANTTRLVLADSPDHTRRHAITAHIHHHKLRPVARNKTAAPHGHRQGPRPRHGTSDN